LINAAGSSESGIFPLKYAAELEGLGLRAASVTGTADVKMQYAVSPAGTNFSDYGDNADIVSSTLLANTTAPEGYNDYSLPAGLLGWIKFKVTGIAANPADTLVTCYLFIREES
jgi:hypothetical protein